MTLSSASRRLKRKNDTSSKVTSEALPKEKVSRLGLAWGYSVGVVQGKDVTSALNVPTNVLAFRLLQLTESGGEAADETGT